MGKQHERSKPPFYCWFIFRRGCGRPSLREDSDGLCTRRAGYLHMESFHFFFSLNLSGFCLGPFYLLLDSKRLLYWFSLRGSPRWGGSVRICRVQVHHHSTMSWHRGWHSHGKVHLCRESGKVSFIPIFLFFLPNTIFTLFSFLDFWIPRPSSTHPRIGILYKNSKGERSAFFSLSSAGGFSTVFKRKTLWRKKKSHSFQWTFLGCHQLFI